MKAETCYPPDQPGADESCIDIYGKVQCKMYTAEKNKGSIYNWKHFSNTPTWYQNEKKYHYDRQNRAPVTKAYLVE